MTQFKIAPKTLHPSGPESVSGFSAAVLDSDSARALEAWFNVTAISGVGATIVMEIQTTMDGVTWHTIHTFAAVTATGLQTPVAFNRADNTLGLQVRAKWTITGTTPSVTFDVALGVMD